MAEDIQSRAFAAFELRSPFSISIPGTSKRNLKEGMSVCEAVNKPPRNIYLVIENIRWLISDSYPNKAEFMTELMRVRDSIGFTAPEMMYTRWGDIARVCETFVPVSETHVSKLLRDYLKYDILPLSPY